MLGKRSDSQRADVNFNKPDAYGIKQLELPPLGSPENPAIVYPKTTTRECIASLIRSLTYRELKQIGDEIKKCAVESNLVGMDTTDIAQTLDDWAHMVKEETEQGPLHE